MDEFGCDYACRSVGEGITKYNIPDDWSATFDVYDCINPLVHMQVDKVRRNPALMKLKLRVVEDNGQEYAGCRILTDEKTIWFKIDYMQALIKAVTKG